MFPSILSEEYRTRFEKDYDWDEFYDDSINRESVEEACDASEDYKNHMKACDKAYEKIEEQERDTVEYCESGGGVVKFFGTNPLTYV
jgi:hypothetical protein